MIHTLILKFKRTLKDLGISLIDGLKKYFLLYINIPSVVTRNYLKL